MRSRFMNKTFTFVAVATLVSGSTVALAQPAAASFAGTFAELQSISSNSSQWQQRQSPSVPSEWVAPARLTVANFQALSSNSSQWQIDQGGPIGIDHGPTFAQTHPRGISFADYQ